MLNISYPGLGEKVSLHNHSVYSEGASTLEEVVLAGKNANLRVLGISDHWVEPPYDGTDYLDWSMPHEKLDEYVENILQLKKKYDSPEFELKLGMEVDFFFENIDSVLARLRKYPFDYLIGSVHYTGVFSVDYDISDWRDLTEEEKDDICRMYYRKLKGAAECNAFTFIGHLDLPKKFGMIDNRRYFDLAIEVLDAVQKNSGAIELNTSGWFKQCKEPYPCKELLQEAYKRNIPVLVNADAHCAAHINRNFTEAYALLKEANYEF